MTTSGVPTATVTDPAASWAVEGQAGTCVLRLAGDWRRADRSDLPSPGALAVEIARRIQPARRLHFDTTGLVAWDSMLIAMLWRLRAALHGDGIEAALDGLPQAANRLLSLAADGTLPPTPPRRWPNPFSAIGRRTLQGLAELGGLTLMVAGLAGEIVSGVRPGRRRTRMQPGDLMDAIRAAGPSALPIIGLVNFLLGAILAFIGAAQLRRFGAEVYVGNLVGLALVRELAVVITAIVLAGRTGGAYAARLATMQGNEEIDALRVLGISEQSYLVLPMTLSLMITLPLLYFYAAFIGIAGGLLVAVTVLQLPAHGFLSQLVQAVPLGQFVFGTVKAVVFAGLIGIVSCRIGLAAGRSSAAVGHAATSAVVAGIVGVIVIDSLFAILGNGFGL